MTLSNFSAAFPAFLIRLLLVFPIWLSILLPITLLSQLVKLLLKPCFGGKKNKKGNYQEVDEDKDYKAPVLGRKDTGLSGRQYDIVIYGVTGFTGRLAALYVAKQYGGKSFKWAIAGRRKDALENIRKELTAIDKDLINLPIIIADSSDAASLRTMVLSTNVILTTAGPFAKYGSKVVKYCAQLGTHYCDITGETDWVREMVDKYDDAAKTSGACIVNMCGNDCVPWDMAVLACHKFMKEKGEVLTEVNVFDEFRGSVSGGTIATIFHSLEDRVVYKATLGFDPLLKTTTGNKSALKIKIQNQLFLSYNSLYKSFVGPFVMAAVNANVIRRSNVLNSYSDNLTYREHAVYPSFFAGFVQILDLIVFATCLMSPPLAYILREYVLPKPGEGPSEDTMEKSFLTVNAFGKGDKGSKCKAVFYFPTDPGYKDTARMLVESGLVLALQRDKVKVIYIINF